jgi:putative ABC transport system permease protein
MSPSFGALAAEAALALSRRPLRSMLTILGVCMGIATLITLQLIDSATTNAVRKALDRVDERGFFIFPSTAEIDATSVAFSDKEVNRIRMLSPHILSVIPLHSENPAVRVGRHRARLILLGDSDSRISEAMRYGRDLTQDDIRTYARVCVLSDSAYRKLVPEGGNPIASKLRADDQRYSVVGVQSAGLNGLTPASLRGDVRIPYTTYERTRKRAQPLLTLRVIVDDTRYTARAEAAVSAYLDSEKRKTGLYQFFDRAMLASTVQAVSVALTLALSCISSISLLVAGIGIMNVMLISVAERLREIGVRKAVGASDAEIFMQFIGEAFLLSFIGCALGCAAGLLVGNAIERALAAHVTGMTAQIAWKQSIAVASLVMTAITLLFGIYPAYYAMRRTPMEALHAR